MAGVPTCKELEGPAMSTYHQYNFGSLQALTPVFAVSSPFLPPNGDVILRSADGHEFHVVKAILTIASPFFQSLFSLPQPEDQSDVPTIPVSENGQTLDILLRFCYPVKNPVVEDLSLAEKALAAALKYEMEVVIQAMCRVLASEKALETQPLRVYAIACQHKLVEETRLAAIATLRAPIEDVYIKEFESLPTVHYFNLLKFHRRVKAEICFVLRMATGSSPERCFCTVEEGRKYPQDNVDSIIVRCTHYTCRNNAAANWWTPFITTRVVPAVHSAPLFFRSNSEPFRPLGYVPNPPQCEVCRNRTGEQWTLAVASLKVLFTKIASEVAEKMDF